jgi:hypothetical protein
LLEYLPPIHQRPTRYQKHEPPEQLLQLLVGEKLADEYQLFGPVDLGPFGEIHAGPLK